MNLFKKLLTLAALIASTSVFAATATFPLGTTIGTTSLVPSRGGAISQITFANAAAATATIGFFNAPTNVLTYTVGAYTNSQITVGTTVVTFTNILGTIQSQTNSTATTSLTPVSASTNNYPNILTYVVPASTTVTLTLDPKLVFTSGLAMTNSATNVAVTVQYIPAS